MESRPELGEILGACAARYRATRGVSPAQARVLDRLPRSRTAALGGHKRRCAACGHEEISYNSCRDWHCPKCQGGARAAWLAARERELLEVPYCHVVFTLPDRLGPVALQNPGAVYGLLFRAVAETLATVALDPRHLGAELGFLAVLHTWGQTLLLHPHLHCVVPGGGLSPDGRRWIPCRKGFLLPVRVLSRVFRGKMLALLGEAHAAGRLRFHGQLAQLAKVADWTRLLRAIRKKDWMVYAKPPFGGPLQVLKYLARYTHRVAISNDRIERFAEDRVTFGWKDYARGGRRSTMTLEALEFVRRFLLHVVPKGFVRIRHFGFLANRVRGEKLARIRALLGRSTPRGGERPSDEPAAEAAAGPVCPACGGGPMCWVETLSPEQAREGLAGQPEPG